MHAFGSSQTHAVYCFFASLECVQKQQHTGFVFRDELSEQKDLLTPDQSFPITQDCVSVLQCMSISTYPDLYSNLKLKTRDVVQ